MKDAMRKISRWLAELDCFASAGTGRIGQVGPQRSHSHTGTQMPTDAGPRQVWQVTTVTSPDALVAWLFQPETHRKATTL